VGHPAKVRVGELAGQRDAARLVEDGSCQERLTSDGDVLQAFHQSPHRLAFLDLPLVDAEPGREVNGLVDRKAGQGLLVGDGEADRVDRALEEQQEARRLGGHVAAVMLRQVPGLPVVTGKKLRRPLLAEHPLPALCADELGPHQDPGHRTRVLRLGRVRRRRRLTRRFPGPAARAGRQPPELVGHLTGALRTARRILRQEPLQQAVDQQMNNGKTTVLEIMCTRELGDPFRRDALSKPIRFLDKYKDYV